MNIATSQEIQEAEDRLIGAGVSALSLMEEAAERMALAIRSLYPKPGYCVAYLGKGNNAGDALSVLRRLREEGWKVSIRAAYAVSEWGDLPKQQLDRLGADAEFLSSTLVPMPGMQTLLLDGLLGLGARLPLAPEIEALCLEMNNVRSSSGAVRIWSVDIPTGLDGDTGAVDSGKTVVADYTAVIGAVKKGLVADNATAYVGRLLPIQLSGLSVENKEGRAVLDSRIFSRLLRPRPYEMYKNQAGHVAVIAGSVGMLGAAKLCSEAALRAGAGLVTLYCLDELYTLLAPMMAPEIIVKPVDSYDKFNANEYDVLVIGPGLGEPSRYDAISISSIVRNFDKPLVLDADGLNLVSLDKMFLRDNILVTPHVGEMSRFMPPSIMSKPREEIVKAFTAKHGATLLFKGARTIVSQYESPLYYNSTGGPSMATAGQGDVLAGVCAGLCAQGMTPLMAGCFGAYLCGLASEIEIASGRQTERSLTSGDTLRALPAAMNAVAQGIL